jgi:hypothetical protein
MKDSFFDDVSALDLLSGSSYFAACRAPLHLLQSCKRIETIKIYGTFECSPDVMKTLLKKNKATLRHFEVQLSSGSFQRIADVHRAIVQMLDSQMLETLIFAPTFASGIIVRFLLDHTFPRIKSLIVPPAALDEVEKVEKLVTNIGKGIEHFGASALMTTREEEHFFRLINDPKFSQLKSVDVGYSISGVENNSGMLYFLPVLQQQTISEQDVQKMRTFLRSKFPPNIPFSGVRFSRKTIFQQLMSFYNTAWVGLMSSSETRFTEFFAEFHSGPIVKANDATFLIQLLRFFHLCHNGPLARRVFSFVLDAVESIILGPNNDELLGYLVYYSRYSHSLAGFERRVIELLKAHSPRPHIVALVNQQDVFCDLIKDEEFLSPHRVLSFEPMRRWPHINRKTALALLQCPKVDIFMQHEFKTPLIKWWLRRRNGIRLFNEVYYLNQIADVFKVHREVLRNHPFLGDLLHYSPFYKRMLSHPGLLTAFMDCIDNAESFLCGSFVQFMVGNHKLDVLINMTRGKLNFESWLSEKVWTETLLLRYGPYGGAKEHAILTFRYVRGIFPHIPAAVYGFASGAKNYPVAKLKHREFIRHALKEFLNEDVSLH